MNNHNKHKGGWVHFILTLILSMAVFSAAFAQGDVQGVRARFYSDDNGNGVHDLGELPLAGQMFGIVGREGTFDTVSNANGEALIQSIPFGTYSMVLNHNRNEVFRIGDRPAGDPIQFNIGPGPIVEIPPVGVEKKCAEITNIRVLCDPFMPGCYDVTFTWTNISSQPAGHIFFLNPLPVQVQGVNPLSGTPNYIPLNPPLGPGQSQVITIKLCGVQPQQNFCLEYSMHTPDLLECCMGRFCFDLPVCDCFQFVEETVTCNPDGSYTWCFKLQSLVPANVSPTVNWVNIVPPPGVTINPAVNPLNPPLAYGQISGQICVTVTGVQPGQMTYFNIILANQNFVACCFKEVCVDFPPCSECGVPAICEPNGVFYGDAAGAAFQNWGPFVGKKVAAVTNEGYYFNGFNPPRYPVVLVNHDQYTTNPPPLGTNWAPAPLAFKGPSLGSDPTTSWDDRNIGTPFGVCFDRRGNIFVTYTTTYYQQYQIVNSTGAITLIWKIENGTGKVYQWVTSAQIPNQGANAAKPGLGNITYDWVNDQLFTTNHEDGKIYRITNLGASSGTVMADVYNPFGPDNGSAGFCPLGERLWGIQWHGNRIYFSRWVKDLFRTADILDYLNQPLSRNQIWSVPVLGNAQLDAVAANTQKEFDMPPLPNSNWSAPVSDIQFSPEGKMMCAERSATGDMGSYAHSSRGVQFECDPATGGWMQTGAPNDLFFEVGSTQMGYPYGSAGGTDYDFDPSNDPNNANSGRRVWFTGDIIGDFNPPNGAWVYGIKGMPITGGDENNSILMDLQFLGKSQTGDIEIPCPAQHINVATNLQGFMNSPEGTEMTYEVRNNTGAVVRSGVAYLDAQGEFVLTFAGGLPMGDYSVAAKGKCWLRRAAPFSFDAMGAANVTLLMLAGDINDDNEVGPEDFSLLTQSFGSEPGSSNWNAYADLNGDGECGPTDFSLLATNFGLVGD